MAKAIDKSQAAGPRKFDSAQQEAYLAIWRTYDRLRALEEELFSKWAITAQQYNVLRLLRSAYPGSLPSLSLVNRLISRAPDVTRMLDRLQEGGWIQRTRSESDRRAVLVSITESGLKLLDEIAEPLTDCHQAQLGHLSEREIQSLCKLLKKARAPHEPHESDWK